jgi:hypothetical protein
MQRYTGSVIKRFDDSSTGNIAVGVQVTVRKRSDNSLATLYATNNIMSAPIANPMVTDINGMYAFYVADGRYNIEFSNSAPTLFDVAIFDVTESFDGIPTVSSVKTLVANAYIVQTTKGFFEGSEYGSASYYFDPSISKSLHNGQDFIAPEAISSWSGAYVDYAAMSSWSGTGVGVFIRVSAQDTTHNNIRKFPLTALGEAAASLSSPSRTIIYPAPRNATEFNAFENDLNVYGPNTYKDAAFLKIKQGTRASPTTDKRPTMWVQKVINSDRTTSEFGDNGAGYFGLSKTGGTSFSVGVTGFADMSGGTGQIIGVHGRGNAQTANSEVFGGWSYASCITPNVTPISLIGHEINCYRVSGTDIGWQRIANNSGNIRGLVITMADGSPLAGTMAVEIGAQLGSSGKWYTGIVNQPNSICPSNTDTTIGNGEFMRLHGSTGVSTRYGGIRIMDGWWQYGISFAEVPWDQYLNGCAILLGLRQRTVYGATPVEGRWTEATADGAWNFQGMQGIRYNGTQILGPRNTGYGAVSGPLDAAAWDTSTASLALLSQKVGAIWLALRNHGLIGS